MGKRETEAALEYLHELYREFLDGVRLHIYANPEGRAGQADPSRILEHADKMQRWSSDHQIDQQVLSDALTKMYEVLLKNESSAAAALLAQKYNL